MALGYEFVRGQNSSARGFSAPTTAQRQIDDLWIRGRYDPDSDAAAVAGFGSVGLSVVGSSVS